MVTIGGYGNRDSHASGFSKYWRNVLVFFRLGEPIADPDPDSVWVNTSPQKVADETLAGFPTRFEWALDDNRLARDRLVADDAARSARRLGIRVLEVDGIDDAEAVADIVADHFSPYLPLCGPGRCEPSR
ncbi:hypothetical protein ACTMTF_47995 [Nonomuraea sp. ZG12]|uniref:hypothetical protein n=1 Tax=Nonomuraea sp. ZG12 TaxID=3452207 RepID=UPI003F8BA9AF